MVQLNFDATNVAPSAPPEALETGWYPANIIDTGMKPTKNGSGNYFEVTHRISSGTGAGRTLKSRLNLQNQNQQAVDIAYAELSSICHAVGRLRVADSRELHGGALEIYVKKVARNDQPEVMTNEIAGYRAAGAQGSAPGFSGATGSQAAAAPAWAGRQQQPAQQPAQNAGWQQPAQQQPAQQVGGWQQQQAPAQAQGTGAAPWQQEQPPAQQQPAQNAPDPQVQQQSSPQSDAGATPPWAR